MNDIETSNKTALKIISANMYLTLATIDGNKPWAVPLFYVHQIVDDKIYFYWESPTFTKHSQNIELNKNTSVAIFNSTANYGMGVGFYAETESYRIKGEFANTALNLLNLKLKDNLGNRFREKSLDTEAKALYAARVLSAWISGPNKIIGGYQGPDRIQVFTQ